MTSTLTTLSSENIDPGPTSEEIQRVIRDSLDQKIEVKRKHKTREALHEAIIATMFEFLRTFTVLGFDMEGEPVIISRANTVLDGEALQGLQRKFFHDILQGGKT
jgi:hypothetical protein